MMSDLKKELDKEFFKFIKTCDKDHFTTAVWAAKWMAERCAEKCNELSKDHRYDQSQMNCGRCEDAICSLAKDLE